MNYEQFLIAFSLLNLLDMATTVKALKRPGAVEGNPIMRKLMDLVGVVPALLLFKAALIAGLWCWPAPELAQWVLMVIYVVIVINNLRVIRKQ
jgi:hypothetical protein